jgi:TPP-dependent pyruvate/acetoin dehydrogenase alpha subunit
VILATERVLADSVLTQSKIDKIHEEAAQEVEAAVKFADESPIESPTEEALLADVYAPR